MWKIATIFFAVVFSLAKAQNSITLECTFSVNYLSEYICGLNQIEVLDPTRNVTFSGEHLGNRTNNEVQLVLIRNSSTPFMIQQIFTTFPNMYELDIQNSHLESINIPDSVQLRWLTLSGNNISRIVNGTFRGQRQLQFFSAIESGIQEIEEDAFVGLESLNNLILVRNQISQLTARTLSPLISALRIDFEGNLLTRVDDVFSLSTNLTYLYLEFNQITAISPRFFSTIRESLYFVNLRGNRCVDRLFTFEDELELIIMNNALTSCFRNFTADPRDGNNVVLSFQGSLSLFDEFGNIIGRVN